MGEPTYLWMQSISRAQISAVRAKAPTIFDPANQHILVARQRQAVVAKYRLELFHGQSCGILLDALNRAG